SVGCVHLTIVNGVKACRDCEQSQAALRQAEARIAELEAALGALQALLEESHRTAELLTEDLKRYRYAHNIGPLHAPERVAKDQLQLAFERVLEAMPPANDVPDAGGHDADVPDAGGHDADVPDADVPDAGVPDAGGNASPAPPPAGRSGNGKRQQ